MAVQTLKRGGAGPKLVAAGAFGGSIQVLVGS